MTTSISTLGQSLSQIARLKEQQITLADLQTQLASGKKSQDFSGLGTDLIVSKRSRADFNALDVYKNNITIADRRLETMITAIEEFQAQAGNLANVVAGQLQQGEIELETVYDLATSIIPFLEDLVNQQDGERYLFSGSATGTEPLDLTGSGTLEIFLQGQLLDWRGDPAVPASTTLTSTQLITSYDSASDTILGYNASLSSGTAGNVTVRADKTVEVDYTTLGNDSGFKDVLIAAQMMSELTNTDPSSAPNYYIDKIKLEVEDYVGATAVTDLPVTPPPTEGSQIFAFVSSTGNSLSNPVEADDFDDPEILDLLRQENQERADAFFAVFNDLGAKLNQAIDDLDQLRFNLEGDRARLSELKEQHSLDQNTLLGSISDAEDADINTVAVQINTLQIQLEASYRVTATLSGLTLTNFL